MARILPKHRLTLTEWNVCHGDFYITELTTIRGFLPSDVFDAVNPSGINGKAVRVDIDGLDQIVDKPDEDGSPPRRQFPRQRFWVPQFMRYHELRVSDVIVFEKLDEYHFRIRAEKSAERTVAPPFIIHHDTASESIARVPFELERDLKDYLVRLWDALGFNDWKLVGNEYPAGDIGRIDLLARHRTLPKWLVIELKRHQASDETIAQLLRYTGWVRAHLAKAGEAVEGMVIAHSADRAIRYALSGVQNVKLCLYDASGFEL